MTISLHQMVLTNKGTSVQKEATGAYNLAVRHIQHYTRLENVTFTYWRLFILMTLKQVDALNVSLNVALSIGIKKLGIKLPTFPRSLLLY